MKEFSVKYDFKGPTSQGGDDTWLFNICSKTAILIEDLSADSPRIGGRMGELKFTTDEEMMIKYNDSESWELVGPVNQRIYAEWLLDQSIEKELQI